MILVDTSVWIDHLRHGNPRLNELLTAGQVLGHTWVTGEIAMGNLRDRATTLLRLAQLPHAITATTDEVMGLIERHHLYGRGIGFVDAALLASAALSRSLLWTNDGALRAAAEVIGFAWLGWKV